MDGRGRVTLGAVAAFARWLHRWRYLLGLGVVVAGVWFVAEILSDSGDSSRSLLALTLFLWSALGLAVGSTLATLPPVSRSSDSWRRRMGHWLTLAGYRLAALAMLVLAAFTVWLSYSALSLALE